MSLKTGAALAMAALLVASAAAQGRDDAEKQLQAAIHKEVVTGDLKAAIEMYRKLAQSGNRAAAARALVRMGQCYEKLGDAEARKAYERVVREFADQKEAVAEARRRLGARSGQSERGVVARLIESTASERVYEVSRDGRFLVCKGKAGIYLRDMETGQTRAILGESPRMRHPLRLSPDGSQIAFLSRDRLASSSPNELHVVRTDGSGLRAFTEKDLGGRPGTPSLWGWSPDGQSVLLSVYSGDRKNSKVILVRVSDGSVRVLGSAEGMSGSINQASMSPDGRFIAVVKRGGPGYMGTGIAIRSVEDWREIPLSPEGNSPVWTPDGKKVLFVSNRRGPTDLWAIPVADGQPTGPAQMLREDLQYPMPPTRDGELFYRTVTETRDLYTVEFDPRTGRPISKATKITHRYVNAGSAWSPDGRLLAYASLRDGKQPGEGDPASLVIRTMATGDERVVTPKIPLEMNLSNPQWFPDNRSLLIQPQWGRQAEKLAKVDVETGDVELFPSAKWFQASTTWYDSGATLSPDGKALYYTSGDTRTKQVRIIRRELPAAEEKELGTVTSARGFHISVSPDGNRLAFWVRPDENSANRTLMTMPARGGEPSPVKTGGVVPWASFNAWSPDGKRIFFVGMAKLGDPVPNQECDIWSVPADGGEPVPLGIGLHTIWFFHLHPDGKRVVFYDEFQKGELWSLKNLLGAKTSR